MMYVIAGALVVIAIVLIAIFLNMGDFKTEKVLSFANYEEAIRFAYTKTDCSIRKNQPLLGIISSVSSDQESIQASVMLGAGLSDAFVRHLNVKILTNQGVLEVFAPCPNFEAQFIEGELVAVIPTEFHPSLLMGGEKDKRKAWIYATIAKLEPVYLGKTRGWLVKENLLTEL